MRFQLAIMVLGVLFNRKSLENWRFTRPHKSNKILKEIVLSFSIYSLHKAVSVKKYSDFDTWLSFFSHDFRFMNGMWSNMWFEPDEATFWEQIRCFIQKSSQQTSLESIFSAFCSLQNCRLTADSLQRHKDLWLVSSMKLCDRSRTISEFFWAFPTGTPKVHQLLTLTPRNRLLKVRRNSLGTLKKWNLHADPFYSYLTSWIVRKTGNRRVEHWIFLAASGPPLPLLISAFLCSSPPFFCLPPRPLTPWTQ